MIVDDIAKRVLEILDEDLEVADLCIGVRYTYAIVKGKYGLAMGVAHTLLSDLPHGVWLEEKPKVDDVIDYISSCNMLYKVIGVALLNAVSQYLLKYRGFMSELKLNVDILDILDVGRDDFVVFVGNIRPLVFRIKGRVNLIEVLERDPFSRDTAKPDTLAPRIIPRATVLFITGTTLENDTLDYILSLAKNARVKVLVGPTAQILPQTLDNIVDYIASIMVEDIAKAVECIKLCGGTKALLRYSVKYVYQ